MKSGVHGPRFEPFFLPAPGGERFCIFHPTSVAPRGAVLYLHPFAEEMNKSRRMAALQSRLLAARGYAVLQIDLFGCGDSSGEFRDATWDIWKQDAELALSWIERRVTAPIILWGLRLGALLVCDYAAGSGRKVDGFVLWQPVVSGEQMLTQFLRLRVANEMLAAGAATGGTQALRDQSYAGAVLEIAGYEISPALVQAIDRLKLAELVPRAVPVHWFEVVPEPERLLPPVARRVADAWTAEGVDLRIHRVAGEPFWTTPEITECAELLRRTSELLSGDRNGV